MLFIILTCYFQKNIYFLRVLLILKNDKIRDFLLSVVLNYNITFFCCFIYNLTISIINTSVRY